MLMIKVQQADTDENVYAKLYGSTMPQSRRRKTFSTGARRKAKSPQLRSFPVPETEGGPDGDDMIIDSPQLPTTNNGPHPVRKARLAMHRPSTTTLGLTATVLITPAPSLRAPLSRLVGRSMATHRPLLPQRSLALRVDHSFRLKQSSTRLRQSRSDNCKRR